MTKDSFALDGEDVREILHNRLLAAIEKCGIDRKKIDTDGRTWDSILVAMKLNIAIAQLTLVVAEEAIEDEGVMAHVKQTIDCAQHLNAASFGPHLGELIWLESALTAADLSRQAHEADVGAESIIRKMKEPT